MRRLLIGTFFVAILGAIALMGANSAFQGDGAQALHGSTPDAVDFISIDMDATGNGNTGAGPEDFAGGECGDSTDNDGDTVIDDGCPSGPPETSVPVLSARQTCATVAVGAAITIAITIDEVDPSDLLRTYQFDFNYAGNPGSPPGEIAVMTFDDVGAQTLISKHGTVGSTSATFPDDTPVVGWDGTSPLTVAGAKLSGTMASGYGTLAYLTLFGETAGLAALTISNPIVTDLLNDPLDLSTTTLQGGVVAVGVPCPLPADLKNVSLEVDPNSWNPPLADLNNDTVVNDVEVSTNYTYTLIDTIHNNGDEVDVIGKLDIDATPDEGIEVSYECQGGEEITLNGNVIDANCQAGATHVANFPDTLDVHLLTPPLPVSTPIPIPLNFDLTCLEPSTHSITFDKEIQPEDPFIPDDDQNNNFGQTIVEVDCVADSDITVSNQALSTPIPCNWLEITDLDGDGPDDLILNCVAEPQAGDSLIISTDATLGTGSMTAVVAAIVDPGPPLIGAAAITSNTPDAPLSAGEVPIFLLAGDESGVGAAFYIDNGVDDDGDTTVDEDPVNGLDDDGDTVYDEDGGTVLPLTITKDLDNLGTWGPTVVTDILTVAQMNPFAGACGLSINADGDTGNLDFNLYGSGTGDGTQLALAVNDPQQVTFTMYLHCGPGGYGYDDDGDAIHFATPTDTMFDAFIDEDCLDGTDDDGDGFDGEDCVVTAAIVAYNNCADAKDPHIVDPNPSNPGIGEVDLADNAAIHDACGVADSATLIGVLPFTPDSSVTIDDVNAGTFTGSEPGDMDSECLVTLPCKLHWEYTIPGGDITGPRGGTIGNNGGQPLASAALIETAINGPNDFAITSGLAITNGDELSQVKADLTLRLGGDCLTPVTLFIDLADAKLADAIETPDGVYGFPNNTPDATTALALDASWSTKLDAFVNVILAANAADFPNAQIWEREAGFADPGSGPIPINLFVFDLGGGGVGPWLWTSYIGDPDNDQDGVLDDLDPDDDNDGIPDAQDTDTDEPNGIDDDGDTTIDNEPLEENSAKTGQCTPLTVEIISLGTSQPGVNDISQLATPGGVDKRICNTISPLPPAGSGLTYATKFTREDIGTGKMLFDLAGCVGESDIIASIVKDENPGDGQLPPDFQGVSFGVDNDADTLIDEDPTLNDVDEDGDGGDGEDPADDVVKAGEPQGINVVFDIENGQVPGDVNAQWSIVGPDACDPTWVGEAGDSVTNTTLAGLKTSIIERLETNMGPGEVRYFERKYMVNCPPGINGPFNIINNVSSASGLPDPNENNNQAENTLFINADPDVDFDGVLNPDDNCNFTPNGDNPNQDNQANLDGDDWGDACDIDDDGDGVPDIDDGCPQLAEDDDGIDDEDGCPDTDVSVTKSDIPAYDVDVSTEATKSVTVTTTNGNYPAAIQTNILTVSLLGGCEARLVEEAGDAYLEWTADVNPVDGFDDTLYSQIERVDLYAPFASEIFNRDYTVHCYQRSQHTIEIQADAVALPPVVEEDVSDNTEKNFPVITAWDVTDVKKTSLAFINTPASAKVGIPFNLTVSGSIHNNGPVGPAPATDTLTLNLAPNCTITGGDTNPVITYPSMVVSANINVGATWEITCTEQSDHEFTATNVVEIDLLDGEQNAVHIREDDTANNTLSTQTALPIFADADLKVTAVTVTADDPAIKGQDFNVAVAVTVHNNGPETPVNADVTVGLSGPNDCDLTPAAGDATQDLSLAASAAQTINLNWTANCSDPSFHLFEATASVAVGQIHVEDPDGTNNGGEGEDQNAVNYTMDKVICDVYLGPAPVPAAPTGPAAGCPAQNPWDGGPAIIVITNPNYDPNNPLPADPVALVSDDLDYSSEAVNIKKTVTLTPIAGGPQICDVDGDTAASVQIFQEAEPEGLSTEPTPVDWTIQLPLPEHDGLPNWCLLEYTVLKEVKDLHVAFNGGNPSVTIQVMVVADTDGDGVLDNAAGDLDNCKVDENTDQTDSNDNTVGDACDSTHDVGEKYIVVLGPAAVNLSDTNGRYMWIIGEMGNFSSVTEQVSIDLTITPDLPAGCEIDEQLILPGQSTFLMTAGEQKFQVYRVRIECHEPAPAQVITMTIEKCISYDPSLSSDDDGDTLIDEDSRDGVDDDGDSEDGEDPPNPDDNPDNDCQSTQKQLIIDDPTQ